MGDSKIIRFPGGAGDSAKAKAAAKPADAAAKAEPTAPEIPGLEGLSPDQRKAIGIVLSGMPYVVVGIKPTQSGADFFTAVGGDATDLRNAAPHLSGVIERALSKRGI
jgi:hypothetical protein